jgi:hypothetical protein
VRQRPKRRLTSRVASRWFPLPTITATGQAVLGSAPSRCSITLASGIHCRQPYELVCAQRTPARRRCRVVLCSGRSTTWSHRGFSSRHSCRPRPRRPGRVGCAARRRINGPAAAPTAASVPTAAGPDRVLRPAAEVLPDGRHPGRRARLDHGAQLAHRIPSTARRGHGPPRQRRPATAPLPTTHAQGREPPPTDPPTTKDPTTRHGLGQRVHSPDILPRAPAKPGRAPSVRVVVSSYPLRERLPWTYR